MKVLFAAILIFSSSMAFADQTQVVCANNMTMTRGLPEYEDFTTVVNRLNAKLKELNVKSASPSTVYQPNGGNSDMLTICVTVTR